jgi:subtilisin family serine protease
LVALPEVPLGGFLFASTRSRAAWRFALVGFLLGALAIGSRAGEIHPALRERIRDDDPSRRTPIWVFFRDRGFVDQTDIQLALAGAQQRIGDAALARRSRVGAALADEYDLPVSAAYKDAIARRGDLRRESRWLNAISAQVRLRDVASIASLPFVREVRPVGRFRAAGLGPERAPDGRILERFDPSRTRSPQRRPDTIYGPSFDQLNEIGVVQTHAAGYRGSRVVVMMLDTGFRKDHEAVSGLRRIAERDFVFGDGNTQNEPADSPTQDWHGTATWSACGGYAPGTLIGPAYGSEFILAKTEDIRSEMPIEEDNYVAALEWGDSLGVEVTSASLIYMGFDDGSGWDWSELDGDTAPITRALDRAAARGILCVNAMGNSGPASGTLGEPADADSILAVGAVDANDLVADFSSRGPTVDGRLKPEVCARGVETWCADANGTNTYVGASGTSLATPLVGGACALLLEAHPEWSAMRARSALMMTADRSSQPDNNHGFGRIDLWSAIHQAPLVVPTPFSLVRPPDGDEVESVRPMLVWDRSVDPRGGAIRYEVWLDEDPLFRTPLVYPDLADTVLTTSALAAETLFHWRVFAEEPGGYRRLSREDRAFRTPSAGSAEDLPPSVEGWKIEVGPNPWRQDSEIRWYAPPGSLGSEVTLGVFDASGRCLARERRTVDREGWIRWPWNPAGGSTGTAGASVYIATLTSNGRVASTKFVWVR